MMVPGEAPSATPSVPRTAARTVRAAFRLRMTADAPCAAAAAELRAVAPAATKTAILSGSGSNTDSRVPIFQKPRTDGTAHCARTNQANRFIHHSASGNAAKMVATITFSGASMLTHSARSSRSGTSSAANWLSSSVRGI